MVMEAAADVKKAITFVTAFSDYCITLALINDRRKSDDCR
jgi:hypothetical protein